MSGAARDDFAAAVRAALAERADPVRAAAQQAYMKSAMPYHGVPMPQVRRTVRALARDHRLDLAVIARWSAELWEGASRREERYAAIELTGLDAARGRLELADLHERQARGGAWWDYVDNIAHRAADLLDAHPDDAARLVRRWRGDRSLWLRRLAIIAQLGRRERTDRALLAEAIEANLADREFFIRKAIGWALRDFARADPDWVRAFAGSHELSPLSRREAMKHL
ncbi:MAG: DNA alkylation repair protein [Bifidobacteriaceae bacterium]|nr:DNA alkylation repair protein [Bifidobacteriaceae bacterium]